MITFPPSVSRQSPRIGEPVGLATEVTSLPKFMSYTRSMPSWCPVRMRLGRITCMVRHLLVLVPPDEAELAPTMYCTIKFGSSPAVWRTPTIKNNENPTWDNTVTQEYIMESMNQVLSIDVWDENRKSNDQLYGNARTSIGKILLNGGTLDVEVEHKNNNKKKITSSFTKKSYLRSNQSNMFITVECI